MILVEETTPAEAALPVAELRAHLRLGSGFELPANAEEDRALAGFLRAAMATINQPRLRGGRPRLIADVLEYAAFLRHVGPSVAGRRLGPGHGRFKRARHRIDGAKEA